MVGQKYLKQATGIAALVFVGLQIVPVNRSNPPVHPDRRIENHVRMTPEVSGLMGRACMDCHSHETKWPWYSHVAPLSWLIARDVKQGRKAVNFSEWGVQNGRRPDIAAATLAAACVDAREGRMPRFPYPYFHAGARLSQPDIDAFCTWTKTEFVRLMLEQKRQKQAAADAQRLASANVNARGELR